MSTPQPSSRQQGNRLKQLRAFCHAALLGSISRAAERVMSSQPAVSSLIRALEDELGVPLFERRGPRIVLTRIGESLYEYAMPLVQAMDRLPDTFAEEQRGIISETLTIGAGQTSAAYLLPRYLKRFRELHPEVQVIVETGIGSQRLRWLHAYKLDLILLSVEKPPRDLQFHKLVDSRFMLITPRDHPLVGRTLVKFSDIEGYRFVGHIPGQHVRRIGDSMMRRLGVEPDFEVEVDGWSIIVLYVAAGLGISAVPEICITERDEVWSTPLHQHLPPRSYGAVTRNDGLLSATARRFLEIMIEDDPGSSHTACATGAR